MDEHLIQIGIGAVVALILFLIFREFVTWYFKFNKMVQLQEEILNLIREQNKILDQINIKTL